MHSQFDLGWGDEFEGHLLWEELANQTVHVLIGATLPRGIRMSKEKVCIERGRDTLMLGELAAVVSREGVNAQRIGLEHGNHGL